MSVLEKIHVREREKWQGKDLFGPSLLIRKAFRDLRHVVLVNKNPKVQFA